jgi:hypothetical protein
MFFKFLFICVIFFALLILLTENKFLAFLDKTWLANYMPFRKLSVPFDDVDDNKEETVPEEQKTSPMSQKEEPAEKKPEGYGTPTDTFTTIGVDEKMDNKKSFAWTVDAKVKK